MLNADDVQIEVFREPVAVQTNAAVRLTHKPTGIVVECDDHGSQVANRDAAMRELERRVAAATDA